MQSGQSLFCLSLRRLAILLTRTRSHLAMTLSIFLQWIEKEKYRRREKIGGEITAGLVHNQGCLGLKCFAGEVQSVCLSFQHHESWSVFMKARNQLEGSRSVCYYGASYEHMKRLLKTIRRAPYCSARMIFFHDQLFSIWVFIIIFKLFTLWR